jgi:hypothetical protein
MHIILLHIHTHPHTHPHPHPHPYPNQPQILIDDGLISLSVIEKQGGNVRCKINNMINNIQDQHHDQQHTTHADHTATYYARRSYWYTCTPTDNKTATPGARSTTAALWAPERVSTCQVCVCVCVSRESVCACQRPRLRVKVFVQPGMRLAIISIRMHCEGSACVRQRDSAHVHVTV